MYTYIGRHILMIRKRMTHMKILTILMTLIIFTKI